MIREIWHSFRRLPKWVQIWVALVLVPINILPLAFVAAPYGLWVACLSVGGMIPNLFFLIAERGFSKRMAVPHVVIWTPLVVLLGWLVLVEAPQDITYVAMLLAVLGVDAISLMFDYVDTVKWWRGDRDIA